MCKQSLLKSHKTICSVFFSKTGLGNATAGVSKVGFLVAKLKPLVAKPNRANLARGAVINCSRWLTKHGLMDWSQTIMLFTRRFVHVKFRV